MEHRERDVEKEIIYNRRQDADEGRYSVCVPHSTVKNPTGSCFVGRRSDWLMVRLRITAR